MASATAGNRTEPQLSEEELRAYLAKLREAPVTDMLGQAYTMLGSWAEAKLGRRDARPLIDAMSGLVQGVGAGLPEDLAKRMRDGIAQLQLAQVQAEQELADKERAVSGQQAAQQSSGSAADQSAQRFTDRLWIPGRDPKPPRRP